MLEIAALLLAHEADAKAATEAHTIMAAQVCARLRPVLSTLMGATGFRSLLSRALILASAGTPALRALTVDAGGALVQTDDAADMAALENGEANLALVAQLLSLLVAFIGNTLTLQLLADIWPRVLHHDSKSRTGDRK